MVEFSPHAFRLLAMREMRMDSLTDEAYKCHFGLSPTVTSHLWYKMNRPHTAMPKHLLMALLLLKIYGPTTTLCMIMRTCEATYTKWAWRMIRCIARLKPRVIVFDNRRTYDDDNEWCMLTVDGTDFRIREPGPQFNSMWYSHKFKGPGVRYEVAVSIWGGDICWTNGPFACGAFPDITIFRSKLKSQLLQGEMVEADNGYRGEPTKIRLPGDYETIGEKNSKDRARARHETINRRFKYWGVLNQTFRHHLRKHKMCFEAVAVMTQMTIDSGEGSAFTVVDYK